MVINIPKNLNSEELTNGAKIRQAATRFGCGLLTNMEKTVAIANAIGEHPDFIKTHDVIPLPNYK